jgi:hypothetical protein
MPVQTLAVDADFGSAQIVGVGGAYAASPDESGTIWFNPALIALGKDRGAFSLSYRRQFALDELSEADASVRQHVPHRITVGAGFARYGESGLFLETRGILALAHAMHDDCSAGVSVRYHRTEFGDGDMVYTGASADLGVAGRPLEDVLAAISLRRLTLSSMYDDAADDPGTIAEATIAWSAPPDITIAAVWSKEEGEDDRFGIGQRLHVASEAEFISGLRFDPIRFTLGGRIVHRGGSIDYVYQSHPDLGGTHVIGVGWAW